MRISLSRQTLRTNRSDGFIEWALKSAWNIRPYKSLSCHVMHGETYRFLTNLSGFSQASFAMLSSVWNVSLIKSLDSRRAKCIVRPVPRADDLDCPSHDWIAGMCFLRLRLISMDARHERQEDSSSRKLMDQATARRRTNARMSWFPGRMPKDTTALT